jgi:hypothetical protein
MPSYRHLLGYSNTSPSLKHLITDGLGYCCLWAFFQRNRQTGLIALRLGVTERAVRFHKARWRDGDYECEGKCNCLKPVLEKLK